MQTPSGRRRSISDPLSVALQPPPNESQAEREGRLRQENEAKKRSDNIDKMLRDTERRNRKKKTIKVLLLGQSESGKSTTLKRESSWSAFYLFYFLFSFVLGCRYSGYLRDGACHGPPTYGVHPPRRLAHGNLHRLSVSSAQPWLRRCLIAGELVGRLYRFRAPRRVPPAPPTHLPFNKHYP